MNDTKIEVHKVDRWRVACECGGHVDIHAGAMNCVDKAFCCKCIMTNRHSKQ